MPLGKVDFFEILQFQHLGTEDYYDSLNLGYRLTASAGSDFPWGNTIGEVRVYAYTGHPFSADAWFAAMKRGRTFVTNGPMLTLSVNSAMPGDEVKVGKNGTAHIHARAWAPASIGSPKSLEIISQGRVIRSIESTNPGKTELRLGFDLRSESGRWIAARVVSQNGGFAHTSPVYVRVGEEPWYDRDQLPVLVAKRLKALDFVEGQLHDPKYAASYAPGEVEALMDRIGQARAHYRRIGRND